MPVHTFGSEKPMVSSVRAAVLALLFGLAACAVRPPPKPPAPVPVPPAPARSIVLQHPWQQDRVQVAYRRGADYDAAALAAASTLFRDRKTGEVHPVDPRLLDLLWDLRAGLGLPETHPIHVVSGYRTPVLRKSGSFHNRGEAADIRIPGVPGRAVAAVARDLGRGGWAHYPGSDHVHVDIGPVRTWAAR